MSLAKYRKVFKGNVEIKSQKDSPKGHINDKKDDKISEKN